MKDTVSNKKNVKNMKTLVLVMLGALLASHASAGGAGAPITSPHNIESKIKGWKVCDFAKEIEEELERKPVCGYIETPLNGESGEKIKLWTSVLISTSKNPKGTIFFNPGGPGGLGSKNMLILPLGMSEEVSELLKNYNVIGIDVRGTGDSTPIFCKSHTTFTDPMFVIKKGAGEHENVYAKLKKEYEDCFKENPKVAYVSSYYNAKDIESARKYFGVPRYIYVGTSYGGEIGTQLMNLFPNSLDGIVLGASTYDWNMLTLNQTSGVAIIKRTREIFEECRKMGICPSNIEQLAIERLNTLNADTELPYVMYFLPYLGYGSDQESYKNYSEKIIKPLFIDDLETAKKRIAKLKERHENEELVPNGFANLTICNDFPQRSTLDSMRRLVTANHFDTLEGFVNAYITAQYHPYCYGFPTRHRPADHKNTATTTKNSIPLLMFSGGKDPVALTADSEKRLAASGGTLLIAPNLSHGVMFESECATNLFADFLRGNRKPKGVIQCP